MDALVLKLYTEADEHRLRLDDVEQAHLVNDLMKIRCGVAYLSQECARKDVVIAQLEAHIASLERIHA